MNEIEVKYVIKAMERFPFKKGYVSIFLSPCETFEEDEPESPVRVKHIGPSSIPREAIQMLEVEMMSNFKRNKKDAKYQDIILILSEPDFFALDWGYGDIIDGTFKKTMDGKNINPLETEECRH